VTVQGTSDIVIGDDLTVTGDITGGTVTSTGTLTAGGGNLTFNGSTLAVTGAATVSTTLGVTGATTLSGGATVATGQALTVNGVSYDYETEGIKQAAPNAGGRSIGSRVTNVLNSVAVTGALQADNLRSRNAQVTSAVDIGGVLTIGSGGAITHTDYALSGSKALTGGSATTFVSVAVPSSGYASGMIQYSIIATDATDFQTQTGLLFVAAVNKGGSVSYKLSDNLIGADAQSAATTGITNVFTAAEDVSNVLAIKATAASDLTETTLTIYYRVLQVYANAITAA
jgi:hypothetical protein